MSARGWRRLLGPPSIPPTRAWHARGRQEFPSTAWLLLSPQGWGPGTRQVGHRGSQTRAGCCWRCTWCSWFWGGGCWGRGRQDAGSRLHPLHCPCSPAWGLRWMFKTQVSAKEREEGSQSCQEWDGRLQRDRGDTFPAEPQLRACGGQEWLPLLPTPCLWLCLTSPRARARPPCCSHSPFPQPSSRRRDVGAVAGKGKSFLCCSQKRIPQPLFSQFSRERWDRAGGKQRAGQTLC